MTLLERISYFKLASISQDDPSSDEDLINQLTPYELLAHISDALAHAQTSDSFITFNLEF